MSKYLWLLDFGHGGITKDGKYLTPGKQYHFTQEPISIYEGDINRKIGHKLIKLLKANNIDYKLITPGITDFPLSTRVRIANDIYSKDKRAIYVSLHSNAVSPTTKGEGTTAEGYEIWTSVGQTKSDIIANAFYQIYKSFATKARIDTHDGDLDKEANFYVLKHTDCPAILIENLFYDNLKEAKFLLSNEGQDYIARLLLDCIIFTENL